MHRPHLDTPLVRLLALGAALALLASPSPAQLPGPGLSVSSSSGAFAGTFVPSCTVGTLGVAAGETVSIRVSGDFATPYALFVSAGASQCQPLPGFGGAQVLDAPVALLLIGALDQLTPCLSCPPAFDQLDVQVPAGLPAGGSLSLQALAFGAGSPALTVAVTAVFL